MTYNKIPAFLVWSLLLLFFFVVSLRQITAGDLWYLLLVGKRVLTELAVPKNEFFLYSADAAPQMFPGWGFGTLMAIAWKIFGLRGVAYVHSAMWTATICLSLMACRLRSGRNFHQPFSFHEITALMCAVMAVWLALYSRMSIRPEVTLYLAWALALFIFEYGKFNQKQYLPLFAFPIIVWGQTLLHTGGFLLLSMPVFYYFDQSKLVSLRHLPVQETLKGALPWIASCLAAALLPILNPNGLLQIYIHGVLFLQNFVVDIVPESFSEHLRFIDQNWHFASTQDNQEFLPAWKLPALFAVYLCTALIIFLVLTVLSLYPYYAFILLPVAILAILHGRFLGLLGITLLFPLGIIALNFASASARTTNKSIILSALIIFASAALIVNHSSYMAIPSREAPLAPAFAKIKQHIPNGGNVFTTEHLSSLVVWNLGSAYKVGYGNHVMILNDEALKHYRTVLMALDGWRAELDRYQVSAIIMPPVAETFDFIPPLLKNIAEDGNWNIVFSDRRLVAFVRNHRTDPIPEIERLNKSESYWFAALDCLDSLPSQRKTPRVMSLKMDILQNLHRIKRMIRSLE